MSESNKPRQSASNAAASILEEFGVSTENGEEPYSRLKLLMDLDDEETEQNAKTSPQSAPPHANKNGRAVTAEVSGSMRLKLFHKSAYAALMLVLGLTVVLIIGGHLDLIDRSIIQQLISGRLHQLEFSPPMQTRLVNNLFNRKPLIVMEGKLRNQFNDGDRVGQIRLKALAFDNKNQLLESRIVFAGVLLSEEELQSLSQSEILRLQSISAGRDAPNLRLRRYQEIPFQTVFFNAGRDVDHTTIRIISYDRDGEVVFVRAPDPAF